MPNNLMIRRVDGITIFDVTGELILHDEVAQVMEAGSARILLNMAGMRRIGAFGIGELVGAYTSVVKAGGQMKLLSVPPPVRRLLDITRLSVVFEMHEDEVAALRSFTDGHSRHSSAKPFKPGSEVFLG